MEHQDSSGNIKIDTSDKEYTVDITRTMTVEELFDRIRHKIQHALNQKTNSPASADDES